MEITTHETANYNKHYSLGTIWEKNDEYYVLACIDNGEDLINLICLDDGEPWGSPIKSGCVAADEITEEEFNKLTGNHDFSFLRSGLYISNDNE